MDENCEKYIQPWLEAAEPLEPKPTNTSPRVAHDPHIRAIIFDVYGTLLISASGDIDQAFFSTQNIIKSLVHSGIEIRAQDKENLARKLLEEYQKQIEHEHTTRRNEGIPHPEVEIRAIWQRVLSQFTEELDFPDLDDIQGTTCLSFLFELFSNPVAPMPGLKTTLEAIHRHGIPLGIVSNAQFYTPAVLQFFLTGTLERTPDLRYFNDDLCMYSFAFKRAKPDTIMYQRLVDLLKNDYDLAPEHALFVGNDMLKDIMPAQKAGMRTALFAGDARSLRTRDDHDDVKNVHPDHVITHLTQILTILGLDTD